MTIDLRADLVKSGVIDPDPLPAPTSFGSGLRLDPEGAKAAANRILLDSSPEFREATRKARRKIRRMKRNQRKSKAL